MLEFRFKISIHTAGKSSFAFCQEMCSEWDQSFQFDGLATIASMKKMM